MTLTLRRLINYRNKEKDRKLHKNYQLNLWKRDAFEVLTVMVTASSIFWDIMLFSPLKVHRRFGETRRLQLHG
jgi:hypothetical protein